MPSCYNDKVPFPARAAAGPEMENREAGVNPARTRHCERVATHPAGRPAQVN